MVEHGEKVCFREGGQLVHGAGNIRLGDRSRSEE